MSDNEKISTALVLLWLTGLAITFLYLLIIKNLNYGKDKNIFRKDT